MTTEVKVLSQEKYDEWYVDTSQAVQMAATPGAAGLKVLRDYGCVACHSLDGSRLVGPTYKGIFGHEVKVITNGKERNVIVDDEYIKNSIFNPDDDLVEGYSKGLMRSYKNELTEEEVEQIIEYLKTLSDIEN
jgi:cytochrome c oxidase subunit 2